MIKDISIKNKPLLLKLGLGLFIFMGVMSFFVLSFAESHFGNPPGDGKQVFELEISRGDSSGKVAGILVDNKIIRSKRFFQFLLRITGNQTQIKQGIYVLNDGMNSREVMNVLISGRVKTVTFTIPEGFHNRQIASLFLKKNLISDKKEFFEAAGKKEILEKYKIPAKSTEGYLFPETYTIPYNYSAEQIIHMMLKRFYTNLETIPEAKDISPEALHEKVILASIIEREAKLKEEQPLMAGVFQKRIKINMPLESCATVQYLFDKPKKRLLEKDLLIISDYNTYLNKGFPPGPISNPGLSAIASSFKPVESENLFFLVKPDGSHYFSKTHKEHLQAKKKYIDVLYQ